MNSPKHSRAAARVEKFQRWRQQANSSATTTTASTTTTTKAAWRSKKLPIPAQRSNEEEEEEEKPPLMEEEQEAVADEEPASSSFSARRQAFDRGFSSAAIKKETSASKISPWKRPTAVSSVSRAIDDETMSVKSGDAIHKSSSAGKKFAAADRWNRLASPTCTMPSSQKSPKAEAVNEPKMTSPPETEPPQEPSRLRVSDVRSLFQQKAASRPVRTFKSPDASTFKSPNASNSFKSPNSSFRSPLKSPSSLPVSPIPTISSPVSESITVEEQITTTEEEPAVLTIVNQEDTTPTKQWDSPRKARLRALAAAAETNETPVVSEKSERSRISDIFQRKIDSAKKDSAQKVSTQKETRKFTNGTTVGSSHTEEAATKRFNSTRQFQTSTRSPPPEPEPVEEPNEKIETPQKLSVSAMKAKLWGDAERLKVPTRKAPSSASKDFEPPRSPISDTRRIFDRATSPVLLSPPRTSYGASYQSLTTPPKQIDDLEEFNDPTLSPMPDSEDDILMEDETYDRTETELGEMQAEVREVQNVATSQETPPSNSWMNRTFKRNIGSALESKIQSLWGGNNQEEKRDMQIPELQERPSARAHPPRPSARNSLSPVRNGESPPLSTVSQASSGVPPPIDDTVQKGHYRSTSIGDFQLDSDCNFAPMDIGRERSNQTRGRGKHAQDDFRAISPPNRPALIQTRDRSDEPLSPLYQHKPFRGSGATYEMADSGFREAIDQPPFEDASETSETMAPISPRSYREDHPWTKDAGSLSTRTWQKRTEPDFDDVQPLSMPQRNRNLEFDADIDAREESQRSPSSLNQMAKDSFYAVDHEQAMERLERSEGSDDERSSTNDFQQTNSIPQDVPPEFERVVRTTLNDQRVPKTPIFGQPESFGAAGDEHSPGNPLSVAERAQAIAQWNGGLGVSPTPVDKQETYRREIAQGMLPDDIQKPHFSNGESSFKGMSPDFERKGVAIDQWNIERADRGEIIDQSTDVWGPVSLDSFPEYDWVTGGRSGDRFTNESETARQVHQDEANNNFERPRLRERQISDPYSEASTDAFSSIGPIDADDVYFAMTASVKQPEQPFVLEKAKTDISSKQPKKLKEWRKSQGKFGKRGRKSIGKEAAQPLTEFIFDPFNDPFESKVDNTETTEPTDNTDLFGSPDPFFADQNLFAPNSAKPIVRRSDKIGKARTFQPDEPLSYTNENNNDLPNQFAGLAAPSGTFDESKEEVKDGSKDDVWSCDIGLSNEGLSFDNGNQVVYDADTSNLYESSAVEI